MDAEQKKLAPNNQIKFATYTRDSSTLLDYADQRYYSNQYGRFMTPDSYQASGGPKDPGSWNRYSYTRGDPVNRSDPKGTCDQTTYSVDDDGTIVVDCTDYQSWSWGDPLDGLFANPTYAEGCLAQLQQCEQMYYQLVQSGGPSVHVTTAEITKAAENLALEWLQNPSCQKLFGTGFGNPESVLQSLITTGSFSSGFHEITLDFGPGGNVGLDALTIPQINPLAQALFGPALGGYLGLGAMITINTSTYGNYALTGVIQEFAETIIEELGHAYNFTPGSGGSSIQYDNPLFSSGTNNFGLINTACNK